MSWPWPLHCPALVILLIPFIVHLLSVIPSSVVYDSSQPSSEAMTSLTATLSMPISACTSSSSHQPLLLRASTPELPLALSNLPVDILLIIFESLDSFPTLINFIRTSTVFFNIYSSVQRPICYSIAQNQFSPEALPVLDMARPNGLAPKLRESLLETSLQEVNSVRWLNEGETPMELRKLIKAEYAELKELDPSPSVIGPKEVKRLYEDSRLVDFRARRFWTSSCVKSLGKDYCMTITEHKRLRTAIYDARSLVSSFLSGDDGGRYYDYTWALRFISLNALFNVLHLCEVTTQGENWILTLLTSRARLHRITADRLGDTSMIREKILQLDLQSVQRRAIWDEGQEKVLQLIELAREEKIG